MNEIKTPGAESALQGDVELVKALIGKTVDNGTAIRELGGSLRELQNASLEQSNIIREIGEQLGQLPNPGPDLAVLSQQLENLGKGQEQVSKMLEQGQADLWKTREDERTVATGMDKLQDSLAAHTRLFEKPIEKSIHIRYFLGKPLLVSGVLYLIIVGLLTLSGKAWLKANRYQENDSKWRCLKLTKDSLVLQAMHQIEQVYAIDADQFRKGMIVEEERLAALFDNWRVSEVNKQEKEELERKAKPVSRRRKYGFNSK